MLKLSIKEINVQNFKSFFSIKLEPDKHFNIIVGENNVGKTTIFEALQLWKRCYDLSIKKEDNSFSSKQRSLYLPFPELYFLRITNDRELFHKGKHTAIISIVVCGDNVKFDLGFKIVKPVTISNAFYTVKPTEESEFDEYAKYLSNYKVKLSKAIFIYQTKPISTVLPYEPIMNIGQISRKIKTGKSQEVLRNKIVIERTEEQIKDLRDNIKDIVNYNFDFDFINRSSREIDEYINLKVKVNGKSLDLHLQGSGFLQVAEIFSTITYVEAPLSILLVDEPDSHIHTTLQKPLINKLRSISNSQIFVISHNDNFVGEAKQGELFYLNSKAKSDGKLESIKLDNFDIVKKELGGTIIALERMNNCEKFIFVEGNSDISYIKSLLEKYNLYSQKCLDDRHVTFFHQQGKDYFKGKLESVNRICKQLVGNKPWVIVYDKDFSTKVSNNIFSKELRKIVPGNSQLFSHTGYCMESILFEDNHILSEILHSDTGINIDKILKFIQSFEKQCSDNLKDVTSDLYAEIKNSFIGQKRDSRPELAKIDFEDFVKDCYIENSINLCFIMNKNQIRKFVIEFNIYFQTNLLSCDNNKNSHDFSSKLFNLYLSKITEANLIYPSYIKMLKVIYAES